MDAMTESITDMLASDCMTTVGKRCSVGARTAGGGGAARCRTRAREAARERVVAYRSAGRAALQLDGRGRGRGGRDRRVPSVAVLKRSPQAVPGGERVLVTPPPHGTALLVTAPRQPLPQDQPHLADLQRDAVHGGQDRLREAGGVARRLVDGGVRRGASGSGPRCRTADDHRAAVRASEAWAVRAHRSAAADVAALLAAAQSSVKSSRASWVPHVPGAIQTTGSRRAATAGRRAARARKAASAVASALNGRPRKTLGWRTPAEALDEHLAAAA